MGLCIERSTPLNTNEFQISTRKLKVKKPGTQDTYVITSALLIECTTEAVTAVCQAARLSFPFSERVKQYPLLWNVLFMPATRFMDMGSKEQYNLAVKQKKMWIAGTPTMYISGPRE